MNDKLKRAILILEEAGVQHKLLPMDKPAVTCDDVPKSQNHDEMVKTIVFKRKSDSSTFAVAVRKQDRVSYAKLREYFQDKISTLSPDSLRALGWEPGECCPLTIPGPLFVDSAVMELTTINTGSGDLFYGLEFPSKLLESRIDVTIANFRED